jgi:hypothetical protein
MKSRLLATALALMPAAWAQFSSGSTGSDGALNYPTAGTYTFDPVVLGLNPAGDNIFNFTTINIAANVTLLMPANVLRWKPVIWLASGNVTIAGTLNLNGAGGANMGGINPGETRYPAIPGAGGFPGGMGAYLTSPATPGGGWGGGTVTTGAGNYGAYNAGTTQLVPLIGGSGGAGGAIGTGTFGGNGGAGGGAIRIVSSTSITLSGSIQANAGGPGGGTFGSGGGGGGSGGAIHLIAPSITVNQGNVSAAIDKISATTFINNSGGLYGQLVTGPLFNPPLPVNIPQVTLTGVNSINAPKEVLANILAPDYNIPTTSAVSVNIAAQFVPVGTVVKLLVNSEQGNDQSISCAALAGTFASSTATCSGLTLPQGVSVADIRAVW